MSFQKITMSSIVTQLHINRLPLPEDMHEVIKSYCFYDAVTGKTRILKGDILETINNAFTSGTTPCLLEEGEINELFLFSVSENEKSSVITIQHQILFCSYCGNYWCFSSIKESNYANQKVKCKCSDLDMD